MSDRPRIFHEYPNGHTYLNRSHPFVNSWFYSGMVPLREIGSEPAQSTSRNPLESPWVLSEEDFTRRCSATLMSHYRKAREETMALTEEAVRVEKEIDERVKALYGV